MSKIKFGVPLLFTPSIVNASYMGGEEVLEYFFIVLFIGMLTSIFTSFKRDEQGNYVSFQVFKFILILALSVVLAIVAGFIGLLTGQP